MTTETKFSDAEVDALLAGITQGELTLLRYEHGGARLYQEDGDGGRALVADFYNEGDREFYYAAPALVRQLRSEKAAANSLAEQAMRERLEMKDQLAEAQRERDEFRNKVLAVLDRYATDREGLSHNPSVKTGAALTCAVQAITATKLKAEIERLK